MKLRNVLIVVKDIRRSEKFYRDLFGLDVVLDGTGNVVLTEGLVLQDAQIWEKVLGRKAVPQNNASVLYFEDYDIKSIAKKLDNYSDVIQYVTPLTELPSKQQVMRFYDPDGNLIELRTPLR